jgi:RNA polymerase sigma factor (sigma-70 family)
MIQARSTRDAQLPMTGAEEQALVQGLAAGEERAIATFFERTHHPVYRMACRLTRDVELRRDWTHEVLIGVYEDVRRGQFTWRRPGSFWAWFGRRAHFRLLDCYRARRRLATRETSLPGLRDDFPDESVGSSDVSTDLDGRLSAESDMLEMAAVVESCLQQVSNERHRSALRLLLFDDLAYDAIAERMQAPLNTVRAWIRRGRLAIRVCVARELGIEIGEIDSDEP